jgi:hypothetical protein
MNSKMFLKFEITDRGLSQSVQDFTTGDRLKQMQNAVSGRIEVAAYLQQNGEPYAAVIVNEEGLLDGSVRWYVPSDSWLYKHWPEHMSYKGHPVAFGAVIIVGDNGRDFTGLSEEQLQFLCN